MKNMIPVTKTFLPPLEEYTSLVEDIWQRQWLTNHGPLVNELELKLKEYLKLDHLLYLTNGTVALQIAIKALGLEGEIITTPFSYVATTSSIVWEGCKPVFVDIDRDSLNIDPKKIEQAITPKTSAILATHVYGNPCDIDAIDSIAKKHGLKIIYDAAHCFGTQYKGKSIFSYGDICTTSFHATKLFHTIEGGAVFTQDPELHNIMSYMRNFGHDGPERFQGLGINGKNSEFHAAMGVVNLNYVDSIIEKRKELSVYYNEKLKGFSGKTPKLLENSLFNFAYYPVVFSSNEVLLKTLKVLNENEIYPRRYFYPSLDSLMYVDDFNMPISNDIASRVLCLPLFHTLTLEEINLVTELILKVQNT